VPEVELTDQCGCIMATGSDRNVRNDNEAVANAASEAFARWLHRVDMPGQRGMAYRFTARYLVR